MRTLLLLPTFLFGCTVCPGAPTNQGSGTTHTAGGSGSVTVRSGETPRPSQGTATRTRTTTTVRPGETARPAQGAGTVTVRPGETARPSQSTGTTTTVRPGETARPSQSTGTTTTVRPGETVRPSQSTGTTTTVRPGETVRPSQGTGTTTTVRPEPLACQLRIARVPRNGRIVVVGTGFTAATTVEVGGTIATIARWTGTELSVEAASAGTGQVTVVQDDERAACGRVTVF